MAINVSILAGVSSLEGSPVSEILAKVVSIFVRLFLEFPCLDMLSHCSCNLESFRCKVFINPY